jgi:hypothetical protein
MILMAKKSQNQFPPQIRRLLKKKGWTWPPDEKLKAEMHEVWKRLSGCWHTEPQVLREVRKDFPGRFPEEAEE